MPSDKPTHPAFARDPALVEQNPPLPDDTSTKRKGCGSCLMGCLLIFILLVAGVAGGGYYVYHRVMKKTESDSEEFKAKEFKEIKSDILTITSPIQGKTLLNGSIISVKEKTDSDLAIVGFVSQVDSTVMGNLFFRGGILVIGPHAVILGDVDVDCWMVGVEGYVRGEIKGKYQSLEDSKRITTPPADIEMTPPASEEPPSFESPPTSAPQTPETPQPQLPAPSTPPAPEQPAISEPSPQPPSNPPSQTQPPQTQPSSPDSQPLNPAPPRPNPPPPSESP